MFRTVLLRSARATLRPTATLPVRFAPLRAYSASALSSEDITLRILDVLKSFEKVNPDKVSFASSLPESQLTRDERRRSRSILPLRPISVSTRSIRSKSSWPYAASSPRSNAVLILSFADRLRKVIINYQYCIDAETDATVCCRILIGDRRRLR